MTRSGAANNPTRTGEAILDSARRLFLNDGFMPTTVAAIADDAMVSVDTIYKAFGGKPSLVRAICQQALAEDEPVPAEVRSDALHAAEPDPREIIRGWGALTTEIAPRGAPILLLLRAQRPPTALQRVRRRRDDRRRHPGRAHRPTKHSHPDDASARHACGTRGEEQVRDR